MAKWPRIGLGDVLDLGETDAELDGGIAVLLLACAAPTTWQLSSRRTVTGTCSPASV